MGKELGIVEEFCKDTRGAVVRECPDCVDAYIKLAEKYRDRVEVLENTIAAANANAALWKRDHDVLKLQLERYGKVLEGLYLGAEKHSGFWARELVAPLLFCAVCRKRLPCYEHVVIEKK